MPLSVFAHWFADGDHGLVSPILNIQKGGRVSDAELNEPDAVAASETVELVDSDLVGTSEVIDVYEKAMSHYFVASSYYDGTIRFSSSNTVPIIAD